MTHSVCSHPDYVISETAEYSKPTGTVFVHCAYCGVGGVRTRVKTLGGWVREKFWWRDGLRTKQLIADIKEFG